MGIKKRLGKIPEIFAKNTWKIGEFSRSFRKIAFKETVITGKLLTDKVVPSHLKITHDFLQRIGRLASDDLKNLTFFTADVEALYTNINVLTAIEDVLEFASENRDSISTYGLHLCDIQELLELLGLFMGTNPAPIQATVKCENEEIRKTLCSRWPEDNTAHL